MEFVNSSGRFVCGEQGRLLRFDPASENVVLPEDWDRVLALLAEGTAGPPLERPYALGAPGATLQMLWELVISNGVVSFADVITVEDEVSDQPMRTYDSVRRLMDVEVTGFDGEGLIPPNWQSGSTRCSAGSTCTPLL